MYTRILLGIISLFVSTTIAAHAQSILMNNVSFELGISKEEAALRCVRAGNLLLILTGKDLDLVEDKHHEIAYGTLEFHQGKLARIEKYWFPRFEKSGREFELQSAQILSLALYQAAKEISTASNCHPTTSEETNSQITQKRFLISCPYSRFERTISIEIKTVAVRHGRTSQVAVNEVIAVRNRDEKPYF